MENMIAMGRTKWSDYCREIFKIDLKETDVSKDKYFLARAWINEGHSPKKSEECEKKLDKFIDYLKSKNLKIVSFNFAYSKKLQKYVYNYIVRSKIHNNDDLRIDGLIDGNVLPFAFFPNIFTDYFNDILDEVPYNLLEQVSKGG